MTGSIPEELTGLTSLVDLNLGKRLKYGAKHIRFDDCFFFRLFNLSQIFINVHMIEAGNKLEGRLPRALGNLNSLISFDVRKFST